MAGAIAKVSAENAEPAPKEEEGKEEEGDAAAKPTLEKQASMKDATKKVGLFGRMFGGNKKEQKEDPAAAKKTEEPEPEPEPAPSTPNPVADLVSNAIAKVEGSFGSPVDSSAEAKKEEAAPAETASAPAGKKIAIQDEEEPPAAAAPAAPAETPAETPPAPAELPAPPAAPAEAEAPAAPAPLAAPRRPRARGTSRSTPRRGRPAVPGETTPRGGDGRGKDRRRKSGVVSAFLTPGGIGGALGKGGAARTTPTERRMRGAVAADDDALLRVHSTSALIPNAILVSPVLRVHLVDSETGFPLNPSGTDTTPVQTAPFDLNRRVKASMSPEWNETLDVEELVQDVTHSRALLLFELLQPVPSFGYYDERPDMFPNGQPAKIAWGFLKLLRTRDSSRTWQAPGAAA